MPWTSVRLCPSSAQPSTIAIERLEHAGDACGDRADAVDAGDQQPVRRDGAADHDVGDQHHHRHREVQLSERHVALQQVGGQVAHRGQHQPEHAADDHRQRHARAGRQRLVEVLGQHQLRRVGDRRGDREDEADRRPVRQLAAPQHGDRDAHQRQRHRRRHQARLPGAAGDAMDAGHPQRRGVDDDERQTDVEARDRLVVEPLRQRHAEQAEQHDADEGAAAAAEPHAAQHHEQ